MLAGTGPTSGPGPSSPRASSQTDRSTPMAIRPVSSRMRATRPSCQVARRHGRGTRPPGALVRRPRRRRCSWPRLVAPLSNDPDVAWLVNRLAAEDDAAALERAAIHIARPLGLDPATTPILDARLDDGSRVAICVPPASPHVAITVRRFGTRAYSATQLVEQGALPEHIRLAAERTLHTRRNILVSGGTGSGKTTLLNALIELIPGDERIVAIEDTLELRIDSPNCLRFEARGLQEGAVTIRDLVRHALRHRPDHIVVGGSARRRGRRPLASPQHRPRRLAHHRPRQQRRECPLAAGELRHAGRRRSSVGRHPAGAS